MFIPSRKAAKELGVHPNTLRAWADGNKIKYIRNPAGQRLYDISSITGPTKEGERICYCRVSSYKQKDDLERQVKFMQERFPGHRVISDVGSGLNFKRKGLLSILELADRGLVQEVVVAHRDRLCRFGFDLVRHDIEKNGGKLLVLSQSSMSPTEELTQDLMSIISVFSCRLHGLRSYKDKISKDPSVSDVRAEKDVENVAGGI